MARYTATVHTGRPIEDAFAYLSDFSTSEEWDPGTRLAERLDEGPVQKGSRFRLRAAFMGRESELTYEIVELQAPTRVVLRGENATVVSEDEMTFAPDAAGGTRVTYDANLRLKGPLRIADPLLAIAFRRIGDSALEGLREHLGA